MTCILFPFHIFWKCLHLRNTTGQKVVHKHDKSSPISRDIDCRFLTLRKKVEPKRLHPWSHFMVRMGWRRSFPGGNFILIPPSKVAPFLKTAPGWSHFGSTFFLSGCQILGSRNQNASVKSKRASSYPGFLDSSESLDCWFGQRCCPSLPEVRCKAMTSWSWNQTSHVLQKRVRMIHWR